jgi:tetratricopeptide (TPR) repeat protein
VNTLAHQKKARFLPPWAIALLVFFGIGAIVLLSERTVKGPHGEYMINNMADYEAAMSRARELSQGPFTKAETERLTDKDVEDLLEASKVFDSMNNLVPNRVTTFFGKGRAHHLVAETWKLQSESEMTPHMERASAIDTHLTLAEMSYRQALMNAASDESDEAKATVPEVHFRLSQVRFELGDYQGALDEAEHAVALVPTGIEYIGAQVAALVQLRRYEEAGHAISHAMDIAPDHPRVLMLASVVELALNEQQSGATPPPEP